MSAARPLAQPDDDIDRKTIASGPFEPDILPNMPNSDVVKRHPCSPDLQGEVTGYRTCSLFTISQIAIPPKRTANPLTLDTCRLRRRCVGNGGARRDRTDDLMLAKHALSQLSYGPEENRSDRTWWAWDDSNVRPHPYQGCALTT
jgi:hypothetical protein